jgi:hypothetical protein
MSAFANRDETVAIFRGCFERYLASEEAAGISEVARSLAVAPVLELHLTHPQAVLSIDFGARTVVEQRSADAAVRLEIEATALHDILLERLDPVQISRVFEEGRATAEGAPEALVALIRVSGGIARCYRPHLESCGRSDLLRLPEPAHATVWQAEGPPRRVIGTRRPWQRPLRGDGAAARHAG